MRMMPAGKVSGHRNKFEIVVVPQCTEQEIQGS
jgi:hypothetical protein